MCRAAQEAGDPHRGYIDRKKENIIFIPMYLGDTLFDWNQICCRVARQLGESIFQILKEIAQAISEIRAAKVSGFFSSSCFRTLAKIAIKRKCVLRSP